ncbi:hypothetical protein AB0D42_05970 [Streptomyces sp. NPDC048304]|uniref:hypothetical protein n=1 Tax=Streptomyces sp. NPDC048304 TaxID=3154820 RepID=UPI0033F93EE5
MAEIQWEEPFCGEGNSCFRIGVDEAGKAYIAVLGQEDHFITDTREALSSMIRDIKAGKADHLLR